MTKALKAGCCIVGFYVVAGCVAAFVATCYVASK